MGCGRCGSLERITRKHTSICLQFSLMQADDVGAYCVHKILPTRKAAVSQSTCKLSNPAQGHSESSPHTCEWLTSKRILLKFFNVSSNHTQASRSKWLVGSEACINLILSSTVKGRPHRMTYETVFENGCTSPACQEKHTYMQQSVYTTPSRIRKVGSTNRARAKAIRILHPPEKSLVRLACIAFVNPSPCRS
jgi:hypothetical protein